MLVASDNFPLSTEDLLDNFIADPEAWKSWRPRNTWLEADPSLKVYVRRGYRILGSNLGRLIAVLDIANINAYPPGRGRFTRFLNHVEEIKPWDGVFIENVSDPRFMNFFRDRGYKEFADDPSLVCFYKLWEVNS